MSAKSLFVVCAFLVTGFLSARADAYPWMIRHEYTACAQCHADPSGAGLLTAYGRAQGEILLAMPYGRAVEDPGKAALFAFGGAEPIPENLLLEGAFRGMLLTTKAGASDDPQAPPPERDTRFIQMMADVRAQLAFDRFRINAALGYAHEGARGARVTHRDADNLVSRTHWIGYDLGEDRSWLLRAGRFDIPFGIRNVEHTLMIRAGTRTGINDAQQHGAAIAYSGERWRGELMGIAGNFQLNPDQFRERGYSGYLERALSVNAAAGVSSQILHSKTDVVLGIELLRQAHGAFARWAPLKPLVIMAEGDFIMLSSPGADPRQGVASVLQLDVEPTQGLHLIGTGEVTSNVSVEARQWSGWLSANWFLGYHTDLRLDANLTGRGKLPSETAAPPSVLALAAQLHFYL